MERTEDFRVTIKAFDEDAMMWLKLVKLFEEKLNTHLSIKDYGTALNDILIIYVAFGMNENLHPNYITHSRKQKELVLQYRLLYENMPKQTQQQNLKVLAQTYLDAIKQAQDKKRIKNFDFTALLIDLTKAFKSEAWLLKEAA